jgi:F-type H+-transporting ATPase subunit b
MEFFHKAESWVLVAFLLFIALLVYLKVPAMLAKMLDDRAAKISSELAEARKLREEAQALLASYQGKRTEAEAEAAAIVANAKADAAAYAEEARKKLADSIERRTRQAEEKIARAEAAAIKDVRDRVTDIAIAAASSMLGEKARGKGGDDLIAESISAVKSRLN